ncbi:MFS transporter [Desulfatirhabdium butyrativorans]|uniref:MFS transporter n=1 Tax=Desulfatirhabdium butyrativorans TaxID=340467 RepID=UPI000424AE2A|nr:MFS transporter [Desulfatirhabdium butyrativorans]
MKDSLFSWSFTVLCLQFLIVSTLVALFFPLQAYMAGLGFSDGTIGFLLGGDALSAFILQPFITPLITAGYARRWILAGSIAMAIALILEGTLTNVFGFIAARLLQGVGFICIVSGIMVLLVLCIPKTMSGRAFGWISLLRLLPYAAMPAIYDALRLMPQNLDVVIRWASAGCVLIAALLPALNRRITDASPASRQVMSYAVMARCLFDSKLFPVFSAITLLYANYAAIFFFLKGYGLSKGMASIGFFFTVATLVMMAIRLAGSQWFDKWNKYRANGAALLLCAMATGMIVASSTLPVLIAAAFLCGVGWGIAMPLLNALVFDMSAPQYAGLNQNLALLMLQAGFFLGPLIGGKLFSAAGYPAVFIGAALMGALAATCIGWAWRRNNVR